MTVIAEHGCPNCGVSPIPMATRVPLEVHPDKGVTKWVCGTRCFQAQMAEAVLGERCVGYGCIRTVRTLNGPGRPPEYCSDECSKNTRDVMRRVYARLARPKRLPTSSAELTELNEQLIYVHATWQPRGWQLSRYNRPFATASITPSLGLIHEWSRQQKAVALAVQPAKASEDREEAEKWVQSYEKDRRKRGEAMHAANQQWREETEKALQLEPDIQTLSESDALEQLKMKAANASTPEEARRYIAQIEEIVNGYPQSGYLP